VEEELKHKLSQSLSMVSYMDAAYKVCRVVLDAELKLPSFPLKNSRTKTPPPSLPSLCREGPLRLQD
jgi:hypothetical protein